MDEVYDHLSARSHNLQFKSLNLKTAGGGEEVGQKQIPDNVRLNQWPWWKMQSSGTQLVTN